jgi:Prokaryotic E2 family E/Multiubiquitin
MTSLVDTIAADRGKPKTTVEVAGTELEFRPVSVPVAQPSGGQIAAAAGFKPNEYATVLQQLEDNSLEDIGINEPAELADGARFIVVASDGADKITIDGVAINWPVPVITGATIRKLGTIPADQAIFLTKANVPDKQVEDEEFVKIDTKGIEHFESRAQMWKLNVQGVVLKLSAPSISVGDAMREAGFDPGAPYHIFIKYQGKPKQEVNAAFTVDLTKPGIEKIRLVPREVNNGEASLTPRRDFRMLPVDERHLDALGMTWSTLIDQGRRWLVIEGFQLPAGYNVASVQMAVEVPGTYPASEIDMFYVSPALALTSGRVIEQTQVTETIATRPFQRWSRHRGQQSPWMPGVDNLVTHLALIESALLKEVGE